MVDSRKLCVVIPVHKPVLSAEERASLLACSRHLKDYACFLVFPEGLVTDDYLKINPQLILKPVPASWLSSIQNYNKTKVSPAFYALFAEYDFMMTYELDAYIFNSNIAEHHGFAFDFIGAPIFEGFGEAKKDAPFLNALNSGFSIRNIKSCIRVLDKLYKYRFWWKVEKFFLTSIPGVRKLVTTERKELILNYHLNHFFKDRFFHEDMIWTQVVPALYPFFKVAPPELAATFSFEVNAAALYQRNHQQLPLGCHAWAKYWGFWKDYIREMPDAG